MSRVDIHDPATELVRRLGLDPSYVREIVLTPRTAEVTIYKGRDGRCRGAKYLENGEPATQTLMFEVET